jgi:hypothetical protein
MPAALVYRDAVRTPHTRGTAVVDPVLAHQGGWDEMAVFLFPAIFGFGLWWIVKRPGPEEEGQDDPETPQQQPR